MPQDGHWLASFEVIPPPSKSQFFRGQKNENCPLKIGCEGCASPAALLKSKNLRPNFFLLLFRLFLSEILSRRCRLSRTTSDPPQKSGKFRAKIAFFLFFRRKIWHDFVTPFSTFANIKGPLSTKSTTPDPFQRRALPSDEDFTVYLRRKSIKNFFSRPASIVVIYIPKEAHSRIFVTGESVFARQMLAKKLVFWGARLCSSKYQL